LNPKHTKVKTMANVNASNVKSTLEIKVTPIVNQLVDSKIQEVAISLRKDLQQELQLTANTDIKVSNFDVRLNKIEQAPATRYKVHPFFWAVSNPLILGVFTIITSLSLTYAFSSEKDDFKWLNSNSIPLPVLLSGLTVIGAGVIKNYEQLDKGGQAQMKNELDYSTRSIIKEGKADAAAQRLEDQKRYEAQRAEDKKNHEEQMKRLEAQAARQEAQAARQEAQAARQEAQAAKQEAQAAKLDTQMAQLQALIAQLIQQQNKNS
jgi:hypothetical protein